MSRTGSGQSWTPKNSGSKIMFGGVYPTVMAATGTAHAVGEALPPYQKLQPRKIYKKYNVPQLQDNVYAGGFRVNLSTGARQEGGYWHNDGNLAISWLNDLLYIGGNWGFPASPPSGDHRLYAAAMSKRDEVILLWRKLETGPTRYSFRVQRNKINYVSGDEISFGYVSDNAAGEFAVGVQVTGFDSTAQKFATLETADFSQTVTLHTFAESYASKSSSVIHSRSCNHISRTVTSTVTGSGMSWSESSSTFFTLVSGAGYIEKIQMEPRCIGLLSVDLDTVTGSASGSTVGSTSANGTDLYQVDYSIIAEKLQFIGTVETVRTVSGFYRYNSDVFSLIIDHDASPETAAWSDNSRVIEYEPFYAAFSASHAVIIINAREYDVLSSQSGSWDSMDSQSDINYSTTTQYAFRNLFNSTELSENNYSNFATGTVRNSVINNAVANISSLAPEPESRTDQLREGWAGDELQAAFGKTVALAHFFIKDPYTSAMPQFSLSIDLKSLVNYQYIAETVIAAGATFTSPIAVLSI